MESFRALRVHQIDGRIVSRLDQLTLDDLSPGNVVIRGEYSSINYKDALATTGKGRILRRFPLVAGVDIAGTVVTSGDARFKPGDVVAVHGCGQSETHDGGFSRVRPRAGGLGEQAAGRYRRPHRHGSRHRRLHRRARHPPAGAERPDAGAGADCGHRRHGRRGQRGDRTAGGARLQGHGGHQQGHSGRLPAGLGASDIFHLKGKELGTKPLEKTLWGGAVDNLGGATLAWLTRTVVPYGNIASVGLAQGPELNTTVMPFILRGVSLLGINSVEVPGALRAEVWRRLAGDLKLASLDRIVSREVPLDRVLDVVDGWVDGSIVGRCLVRLR